MLNRIDWKIKYGIIAAAFGVILLVMSVPKALSFLDEPIKVDSVEKAKNLKAGDHVTIDVNLSDGYYMSFTEDGKETARYYIAYFIDLTSYKAYGLTVRVGRDYYSNMEEATKALDTYFDDFSKNPLTPIPNKVYLSIDGVIEKLSQDKEKEYAKEYVDAGYMDYIYVAPNTKSASFIIVIIGAVFLLIGAVLIIFFFLGKKKAKAHLEEMRAANPGYYHTPDNITFNNDTSSNITDSKSEYDIPAQENLVQQDTENADKS